MTDMNNVPVPSVLFKSEAPGVDLYITEKGLTYFFFKVEDDGSDTERDERNARGSYLEKGKDPIKGEGERIDILLSGADIKKENIISELPRQGHYNFFLPHCPNGIYDVVKYDKVTVKDVYPGIDWILYNSTEEGFKYDFIVHPGANPESIELLYKTGSALVLDGDGNLELGLKYGHLKEKAPYSYLKGSKKSIPSKFRIKGQSQEKNIVNTKVNFVLSFLSKTQEDIVIDPQLVWATFYGGNMNEGPMALDTDTAGNLFITGYASSNNFPISGVGSYTQSFSTGYNIAITKFDMNGALDWSTTYGGNNMQSPGYGGNDIITDQAGNVFVTGQTTDSLLPLQNASTYFQSTMNGVGDVFILKFNNAGTRLWATFYGGSSFEFANSMSRNQNGDIYVVGHTGSPDFPLQSSSGYNQSAFTPSAGSGYILKFDNSGNRLWATFFGDYSPFLDLAACDSQGNLFISGSVQGTQATIPVLNPGGGAYYQATPADAMDVIVVKFTSTGTLTWSTYYGGTTSDGATSIVTDASGNLFITGYTYSSDFPLKNAGTYFHSTQFAFSTQFFLKFSNNGTRLWATYFEAEGYGGNLAVDTCGTIYCAATSVHFPHDYTLAPCDGGYFSPSVNGLGTDNYLYRFSNDGDLYWASYFGGTGEDFRNAVGIDIKGNLYVSGEWSTTTGDTTYPTIDPGNAFYQNGSNGGDDWFISRFRIDMNPNYFFSYPNPICFSTPGSTQITPTVTLGGGTFSSSPPGLSLNSANGVITLSSTVPGTYLVSYAGSITCGCYKNSTVTNTISIGNYPVVSTSNQTICAGTSATLLASANPSTGTTYSWNVPSANTNTLVVTPTTGSSYVATATNSLGCKSSATAQVAINPGPNIKINGDTSVCPGIASAYSAQGASSYTWSTGTLGSTISVSPTSNSSVSVTGEDSLGCMNSLTKHIVVKPVPVVSINAPLACEGFPFLLAVQAPSPGVIYTWLHSGSISPSVTVQPPALSTYTVQGDLDGCITISTVAIIVTPTVSPVTAFNYGGPFCFSATNKVAPIHDSNFATGGTFYSNKLPGLEHSTGEVNLSQGGTFIVTYSLAMAGCTIGGSSQATLDVAESIDLAVSAPAKIAPGESATLIASGGESYSWSPDTWLSCANCPSPVATPPSKTEYCVLATVGTCTNNSCITVDVGCRTGEELDIPNAFTPNGDGKNDRFCIKGWSACLVTFEFMVFDRWGEKVFESRDANSCWDGSFRGQLLNSGVFVYTLKAVFENNMTVSRRGNITLIR